MQKAATFDETRKYRYTLTRNWSEGCGDGKIAAFIGLNPSTADENIDDPTIRRCIRFAKDWGYDGMVMLNIFAFRATDPIVMKAYSHPVGELNNGVIFDAAKNCGIVIAAWGVHGEHRGRGYDVKHLLHRAAIPLYNFGLTKSGQPKHPLYLRADTKPQRWEY